ncbi:MAG: RNA polymerase sigma factor SigZ [Deltaproteobacteria bacterium]
MSSLDAKTSWEALANEMRPFVRRRVASEADADDVLQEVLLRVHRGLDGLEDEQRFAGWIHRVAYNAIADHLRVRQRHPIAEASNETAAPELEPEDTTREALKQTLSLFVAQLPSPYREAITLVELEGLSQREAADLVGISVSGMKSRVQRGRQRLREMLEDCCEIALDARNKVLDCRPRGDDCNC